MTQFIDDGINLQSTLELAQYEVNRLNSSPEIIELCHGNEYPFLLEFEHWVKRGYRVGQGSVQALQPGDYSVQLFAPDADLASSRTYRHF